MSSRPVLVYRASLRTSRASRETLSGKKQDKKEKGKRTKRKKEKRKTERDRKRRSHSTAQLETTPSPPDSTGRLEARTQDSPRVPPRPTLRGSAAGGRLAKRRAPSEARNPGSRAQRAQHVSSSGSGLLREAPPPPRPRGSAGQPLRYLTGPPVQRAELAVRRGCVLPAAGLTCRSRCWGAWGCGGGGRRASGRGATRPSAADGRGTSGSRPVPPWRWRRSSRRSTRLATGWLFTRCGAGGP